MVVQLLLVLHWHLHLYSFHSAVMHVLSRQTESTLCVLETVTWLDSETHVTNVQPIKLAKRRQPGWAQDALMSPAPPLKRPSMGLSFLCWMEQSWCFFSSRHKLMIAPSSKLSEWCLVPLIEVVSSWEEDSLKTVSDSFRGEQVSPGRRLK